MPEYKRNEIKFWVRGINLTRPEDLHETKTVPYCLNMRQYQQGTFQHRPGLVAVNPTPLADLTIHSILRLSNYPEGVYTRYVGAVDDLYSNDATIDAFTSRASGFTGKPLAMLVMRPPQSPESWVYVGDRNKSGKGNVEGTFYNHGIAPPTDAPYAQQSATVFKVIDNFEAVGAWTNGGTAGVISAPARVNTTISAIVYDDGLTGWATVAPNTLDEAIQPGMLLIADAGETVLVESVSEAVTTTTISSIQYETGTTGPCTIQLSAPTDRLTRDSMLQLDAGGGADEVVRVLSVTNGPGGMPSFQCSTVNTHTAGEDVDGLRSFRAVFVDNHLTGETLTSNNLESTIAVGVGYITLVTSLDLSSLNGRPITDNDEVHISLKLDVLDALTEGKILLDIDATLNDFTRNYYFKAFRANDLTLATTNEITTLAAQQRVIQRQQIDSTFFGREGFEEPIDIPYNEPDIPTQTTLGESQWTELRFKVKDLIKVGSDSSRSLHDVAAVRIQLQVTSAVILDVDAWWVGGTYGADSLPQRTIGAPYKYRYVYRSKATGAQSNPSPPMREGVIPRRQQISGTVTPSTDPQVDVIDVYRTGGALISINNTPPWFYVMTIANVTPAFEDDFPDDIVIRNRQLDFNNFQPFLDVDLPRSGTCDVVGTEVTGLTGDDFNTAWPEGTIIIINSVPYTLYKQPSSTTALSLNENAGTLTGVRWEIAAPRLVAQPMPAMWGPFGTGIIEPIMFACGSDLQPGVVFWTRPGNPDGHSQFGALTLTAPSEPLVNGVIFRSQGYVFSSEALYLLTPQVMQGELSFVGQKVAGNRGLFSRYALCVGDEGIFYLSRDGIYMTQGGESLSLTDEFLYPLFTHEGAPPATSVNGIAPPDFCEEGDLRLFYGESTVYFDFKDINGNYATLMYDIKLKGWFYYVYGPGAVCHYFEEGYNLNTMLVGGSDGRLYLSSGNTDDGEDIPVAVHTEWYDGGDPRSNKQWANGMLDFAGCDVRVQTLVDFATSQIGDQTVNSVECS